MAIVDSFSGNLALYVYSYVQIFSCALSQNFRQNIRWETEEKKLTHIGSKKMIEGRMLICTILLSGNRLKYLHS